MRSKTVFSVLNFSTHRSDRTEDRGRGGLGGMSPNDCNCSLKYTEFWYSLIAKPARRRLLLRVGAAPAETAGLDTVVYNRAAWTVGIDHASAVDLERASISN